MPVSFTLRSRIAALHLVILAMLVSRRPECLLKPQFWAEDGAVFFAGQMRFGFWHAVLIPYSGYLHVVPRVIAGLFSGLEIRMIPAAYSISSILIASFCCSAFAWPSYRWLISSDLLRSLCCLVMASAIPAGAELVGTICNLQWFLAPVAILIVFSSQQFGSRKLIQIAMFAALILIALSTPALFVLVPLLFWQIIRKTGSQRWKSIAIVICLGIELLEVAHTNAGGNKAHWNFDSVLIATIAGGIAKCVLAPLLGGSFLLDGSTRSLVAKLILTLIVVVILLTLLLFNLKSWSCQRIVLTALYIGFASVAVVMGGRNLANDFLLPSNIPHIQGERYFFLPTCVFIFLGAFGMEFLIATGNAYLRKAPILLFILAFSLGAVRNFETPPVADLSWPSHAAQIEQWKQSQQDGQPVLPLVIPVNPPGFSMTLEPRH